MYLVDSLIDTRLGIVKTAIDASSGNGRLEVLDSSNNVLFYFEITKGSFTFAATSYNMRRVGYKAYTGVSTTVLLTGKAAKARIVNGDGALVASNIDVFTKASDIPEDNSNHEQPQPGVLLPRLDLNAGDFISYNTRASLYGSVFYLMGT